MPSSFKRRGVFTYLMQGGLALSLWTQFLGCGGSEKPTVHLQGTITLGGKPLPADATGSIMFAPSSKEQSPGATAEIIGGKYDAANVPQGTVRVSFSITQPTGTEYTSDRGVTVQNVQDIVPPTYGAGVEVEITGDDAARDFDLK